MKPNRTLAYSDTECRTVHAAWTDGRSTFCGRTVMYHLVFPGDAGRLGKRGCKCCMEQSGGLAAIAAAWRAYHSEGE